MDEQGDFKSLFRQLRQSLLIKQQRAILRFAGEQSWAIQLLESAGVFESTNPLRVLSFIEPQFLKEESTARRNEWRLKHYPKALGQEFDVVLLDAYEGFNLNAFAALSGVLPIGGIYILITPDDNHWPEYTDPESARFLPEGYSAMDVGRNFIPFFISKLNSATDSTSVYTVASNDDLALLKKKLEAELTSRFVTALNTIEAATSKINTSQRYQTPDQQSLAQKVINLLSMSHQNGKAGLLVCADRGRGKSAGIGRALSDAIESLAKNELQVVVTGPTQGTVETLLKHFNESQVRNSLTLNYQAPDAILENLTKIDILVIDEAAAMPVSLVQQLVSLASKTILATTIHGYEGTGRGFEYKLKPWLATQLPQLQQIWLRQPIRWQEGDHLEGLINDSLCLNSSTMTQQVSDFCDTKLVHEDKPQLIKSDRISEIFALLSEAHYQTTPNDLRSMLDSPTMEIFTLQCNGPRARNVTDTRLEDTRTTTIVATILVSLEGGERLSASEELVAGIWQGRRRPRGHLAPQSLSAHCGYRDAVNYRFARVVRIAVAPQLQSKGLGSIALQQLERFLNNHQRQYDIDLMSTSFGCDQRILKFWQEQDYQPVRLGLKKETSTGEHSVLLVKPLKQSINTRLSFWNHRFIETLAIEHKFQLRSISTALVAQLAQSQPIENDREFSAKSELQNKQDIEAFAHHFRSADSCYLAFQSYSESLEQHQLKLCKAKFLDGLSNAELIKLHKLNGEKSLILKLRDEAKQLYLAIK